MIDRKSGKNIDLLGNNFHTVIDKYSPKPNFTAPTFRKNKF